MLVVPRLDLGPRSRHLGPGSNTCSPPHVFAAEPINKYVSHIFSQRNWSSYTGSNRLDSLFVVLVRSKSTRYPFNPWQIIKFVSILNKAHRVYSTTYIIKYVKLLIPEEWLMSGYYHNGSMQNNRLQIYWYLLFTFLFISH